MLSTADYVAMGILAVSSLAAACVLFERYIMYKRLYERYSKLEEGGEFMLDAKEDY